MAHIFQVPVGFQYFRRKVKWHFDELVVIGWEQHQDGTPDTDSLRMRVRGSRDLEVTQRAEELPERLLDFLNSWGPWTSTGDWLSRNYIRHARLSDIVSSHRHWIKALSAPADQWLS